MACREIRGAEEIIRGKGTRSAVQRHGVKECGFEELRVWSDGRGVNAGAETEAGCGHHGFEEVRVHSDHGGVNAGGEKEAGDSGPP